MEVMFLLNESVQELMELYVKLFLKNHVHHFKFCSSKQSLTFRHKCFVEGVLVLRKTFEGSEWSRTEGSGKAQCGPGLQGVSSRANLIPQPFSWGCGAGVS